MTDASQSDGSLLERQSGLPGQDAIYNGHRFFAPLANAGAQERTYGEYYTREINSGADAGRPNLPYSVAYLLEVVQAIGAAWENNQQAGSYNLPGYGTVNWDSARYPGVNFTDIRSSIVRLVAFRNTHYAAEQGGRTWVSYAITDYQGNYQGTFSIWMTN